ncbi:MAG TPA: peptide chain release factor 1 [Rubricoccaceae bacterium]|jgi:peptide chain release factor 1
MIRPDALSALDARYGAVSAALAAPDVAQDVAEMTRLSRELSALEPAVQAAARWRALQDEVASLREMMAGDDAEMAELAEMEIADREADLAAAEEALEESLVPRDPEDARDVIVEIRAGTGGDEAALFAGDLYELYQKWAAANGWRLEPMDASAGGMGGFREITFGLKGGASGGVYGTMKFESGVHRVQRVPATESQGRIHTSAATVAVLPEAEEVDVDLRMQDVRVDVFRASGPGGQSVNTTDSAVRLTHVPTGLVVSIQDEKSQLKNKDKAFRVLRSRLYQLERDRIHDARASARKELVGSGDRSAKIRTYNYPQGRVTDHRLDGDDKNHALAGVLAGELAPIVRALQLADRAARMDADTGE